MPRLQRSSLVRLANGRSKRKPRPSAERARDAAPVNTKMDARKNIFTNLREIDVRLRRRRLNFPQKSEFLQTFLAQGFAVSEEVRGKFDFLLVG
jgi:hypothetical protein